MTNTAVLFPGQGSLAPGSAELAREGWPELIDMAAELVGDDPFARAAESTAFAQPAIFVASLAGYRDRRIDVADVLAMAGHSLGELSALTAAGALDVEDGLELVVLRGRLMEDAAAATGHEGGMLALLGGTPDSAGALAESHGLTLANDNAPGQVVLSGPRSQIDQLASVARGEGFKSLVLDVPGAFHSGAIAAAEQPFLAALRKVEWRRPLIPVLSGLTAAPFEDIPAQLARALVSPVRWREVMTRLVALGARAFVDVGPGQVLARLVARNVAAVEEHALSH